MSSQKHTGNQFETVVGEKPASVGENHKPEPQISVLLIEDSATHSLLIQQMLRSNATTTFRLRHADCIAAGIKQLDDGLFDVVLLDLMLPDGAELDTFSRLYARHPDIPIVVLTGIDGEQIVAAALQKGAQDYLIKSKLNEDMLVRSIRFAVERNRRQQAERIVLQTQLEERRRLARELHDGVIQSLSAMRLQLQILDDQLSRTGDSVVAGSIRELADEALAAIHDVRQLSHDLHPSILDKYELPEAIEFFGKQLEMQNGLEIEITNDCTQLLGDHIKNHLYRIVQESMRNAAKHAGASRMSVVMRDHAFFITVEIHDDGIGFDESENGSATTGLGLISMRERARLLGGSTRINSRPG